MAGNKEQEKAKEAAGKLGGMSGAAAKAISGRQRQIDEAVDSATGSSSPNQNESKGADGNGRPAQRKRWYE